MKVVVLFEWVDACGDAEDFIVLDLKSSTKDFFDFPDTNFSIHFKEEAEALVKDYEALQGEKIMSVYMCIECGKHYQPTTDNTYSGYCSMSCKGLYVSLNEKVDKGFSSDMACC